jgi:hypothetical protein
VASVGRGHLRINPASIVGPDRPLLSKDDLDVQLPDQSSIKFHFYIRFSQIIHNSFSYITFGCVYYSAEIFGYGCEMIRMLDIHQ